mmetsp:Transcript_23991/g.47679  ORF Transcript_23991/g.47679 Transcript_23991/m.47679 type:complete len:219 (+) Transcript_23991:27-683(+)
MKWIIELIKSHKSGSMEEGAKQSPIISSSQAKMSVTKSTHTRKIADENSKHYHYYWMPDALWHVVLSFLDPLDLCSMVLLNKKFQETANRDDFWKLHCLRRWQGKQGMKSLLGGSLNCSWKQGYAWAEYDKFRQTIRRDEICQYSWKLIYNGVESRMGLRRFNEDGTYNSPYAGLCEWALFNNGLCFMGVTLPVERNQETWGWVIGQGHRTEYRSIER